MFVGNVDRLGIVLAGIDAAVISHGHHNDATGPSLPVPSFHCAEVSAP